MKKVFVLMLSIMMVISMAACGNSGASGSDSENDITVYIEIDYPDESGIADVDDIELQVSGEASALDVLNAYAESENVEILMSDTSVTAYVTSVNGIAETSSAGWIYEINDEMALDAANDYIVSEGDEISWEFTSWDDM